MRGLGVKVKISLNYFLLETETQKKLGNFAKLQFLNDKIFNDIKKAMWHLAISSPTNFSLQNFLAFLCVSFFQERKFERVFV